MCARRGRGRERAADLEARSQPAEGLDRAAGLRDDVLHDREAEPGPAGGPRSVGAEEALEEPPELRLFDANPVVRTAQDDRIADTLDRKRERRAGPRVADRVLGEVLGNDADHPRPDRELDARLALDGGRDPHPARARLVRTRGPVP